MNLAIHTPTYMYLLWALQILWWLPWDVNLIVFLLYLESSNTSPTPTPLPGEGKGNPLQYSCLGNSMDRGAWRATVHGVTKSQTWLSMYKCPISHSINYNSFSMDSRFFLNWLLHIFTTLLSSPKWISYSYLLIQGVLSLFSVFNIPSS